MPVAMPKRMKFVVEQWVLFMVRRQTWQVRRFDIFELARHFRIVAEISLKYRQNAKIPHWLP